MFIWWNGWRHELCDSGWRPVSVFDVCRVSRELNSDCAIDYFHDSSLVQSVHFSGQHSPHSQISIIFLIRISEKKKRYKRYEYSGKLYAAYDDVWKS